MRFAPVMPASRLPASILLEPVPPGDDAPTGSAAGHGMCIVPLTIVTEGDPNTVDTTVVNIELTPQ